MPVSPQPDFVSLVCESCSRSLSPFEQFLVSLDNVQEPESFQEKGSREFLEAVDLMIAELGNRFPFEQLQKIAAVEQLLVKSAKGKPTDSHLKAAPEYLDDDVDEDKFAQELSTFSSLGFTGASFLDLVEFLRGKPIERRLFPEVVKVVKLLLTLPVTAATAERSFSVLRRIKSWGKGIHGSGVVEYPQHPVCPPTRSCPGGHCHRPCSHRG